MGYRITIALLLLPLLPLKARIHLPLPELKNMPFTAQCYASPFDRLEQKYFAGPQLLLLKNQRRTNLYLPANISLKKTHPQTGR